MTSRRTFLATLVAAIAGRALVRKPPAPDVGIPIRGSMFNPREDLDGQWKAGRASMCASLRELQRAQNVRLTERVEALELRPSHFGFASLYPPALVVRSPIEFDPHFGIDFEWNEDDPLLRLREAA